MAFKIIKKSSKSQARLGKLTTPHGQLITPLFMPDATSGAVKGLAASDLAKLRLPALVVNTLHLYSRPGLKVIKKFKDLHRFIHWPAPLLSDSGGYQVYSLIHQSRQGKITNKGAVFNLPGSGRLITLTPEKSIQIQFALGADLMVVLDDCPAYTWDKDKIIKATQRTLDWAKRSKEEYDRQLKLRQLKPSKQPLLFGVVQGGLDINLRRWCTKELLQLKLSGLGFGARPVDPSGRFLNRLLKATAQAIPQAMPRLALGVGKPEDIVRCVRQGWDLFDCVIPTREARHGRLYLWRSGKTIYQTLKFYTVINITRAKYASDTSPLNQTNLKNYSPAYLHHLFKTQEQLAQRLATLNNLQFYMELMHQLRQAIKQGRI